MSIGIRSGLHSRLHWWLQQWSLIALLCAAGGLSGCATQQVTQVTLSGVVVGERAMTGSIGQDVIRLTRGTAEIVVAPDMVLLPGDAIWTGPDTAVVISYPGGARAYLYPNTRARIGSLFVEIGKVFVKVRGLFQVKTTFVTAASEGTQYWVVVQPGGVRTVVVDGRVNLYSNEGAWSTVLGPARQSTTRGALLPQEPSPADPGEIRRELDWVKHKDAAVPTKSSFNMGAVGVGAAAAAAIWYIHKSDKRAPPRPNSDGPAPAVPPLPAPSPSPAPSPAPVPGTRSGSDFRLPR